MAKTIYDTYQTSGPANPVFLSVEVGFAQLGATSVTIESVPKIEGSADSNGIYKGDFTISLGSNGDLKGKLLEITSNVDILKLPANSSLAVNLTGGTASQGYNLDNPSTGVGVGDVIEYYASITFL